MALALLAAATNQHYRPSWQNQRQQPKSSAMTNPTKNHEQSYSSQRSVETELELLWASVKTLDGKIAKIEEDKNSALLWGVRTLVGLLGAVVLYGYNLIFTGKHLP